MRGLFGSNIKPGTRKGRHAAKRPLKYTRGLFEPAISDMEVSRDMYATNEPIHRKAGEIKQADLEKEHKASIGAAIRYLKKGKK